MIFSIIYYAIKYWLTGLLIFLLVCFIIPEKKSFTDSTVYMDIPNAPVENNVGQKVMYIYKDYKNLENIIIKWAQESNHEKILIVVPRFEFFIYYFWLKENKVLLEKISYKLGARTTCYNISYLIHNYHQTVVEIFSAVGNLFSSFFKKA
jgi:hypothetical protein